MYTEVGLCPVEYSEDGLRKVNFIFVEFVLVVVCSYEILKECSLY